MPLEKEKSGQAFFPVQQEESSSEVGTDEFRQEGGSGNEVLCQETIQFLDLEQGLDIQCVEIVETSNELDPIPLQQESYKAENDGLQEEIEQNKLFPEIDQLLDLEDIEQVFQIQCAESKKNEQDPATSGPSSGDNKNLDLKRNNDRGAKAVELQRKSSASSKTVSNNSRKHDRRGKCCECNKVYLAISYHSRCMHKGKLEKCTALRDCKKYFASAQNRIEHEKQESI